MIEVTARYFAWFREQAGQESETLTTSADTASALFSEITERHGFGERSARCKVAINDELVAWDSPLSAGDVVLFFPPVAGG